MHDELLRDPFRFILPSAQMNAVLEEYYLAETVVIEEACLCPNCGSEAVPPIDEKEAVYCDRCGHLIALGTE